MDMIEMKTEDDMSDVASLLYTNNKLYLLYLI